LLARFLAEQAASYGIAYDITRGVTLQSPTRGGPPISVYVPAPGRAPADRTRLAQLEVSGTSIRWYFETNPAFLVISRRYMQAKTFDLFLGCYKFFRLPLPTA
jgi:hypothetical protein